MATSSRGRITLAQWHRVVSVLQEYISVKGGKTTQAFTPSSGVREPQAAAAALQALNLYLQQLRPGPTTGNHPKTQSPQDIERELKHSQGISLIDL